jgi:hypothetical protein
MAYQQFNTENLDHVRRRVNETLVELGKELGIDFKMTGITYGQYELTGKLEAKITSPFAKYRQDEISNRVLGHFGLKVGDILVQKGKRYQVESYNAGSRKRPIVTKCLTDGKTTVWPTDLARQCKV